LVDVVGWISCTLIRFFIILGKKSVKGVNYQWIRHLDERVDSFWEKASMQYNIMVKKDFKYLDWRYCKRPNNDYHILQAERNGEIIGIIILKYEGNGNGRTGFIMEYLTVKEPYLMENLVKRGLVFLSQHKVDEVFVRLSSGDPVKDIFKKIGFKPKECRLGSDAVYKTYSSKVEDSFLRDPSLWHISYGDCDSL